MSVQEHPSQDSATRTERATQTDILDIREIDGAFVSGPEPPTVYEVDLINEDGEERENVVLIPRILFENTKDVEHRHDYGIVGKYTRALAMESEQARRELEAGIEDKRDEIAREIRSLKEKDSRLLHTAVDMDSL